MAAGALLAVGSPAQIKASAARVDQVGQGSGKPADGSPSATRIGTSSPTLEDAFIALIQQRKAA
jgi:hypothetical protein